jgi:multiple sugar transport system permease protein
MPESPARGAIATPRRRSRSRLRRNLTGWAFIAPAALIILGLSIFPTIWATWLSTQKTDFIVPGKNVGLDNYRALLDDPRVWEAVKTTLLFTAMYVPLSVGLGLAIAIALNQKIRLNGFYRTGIFVPYVASAAATGILATFVFNREYGIANDLLAMIGISEQPFFQDPDQALILLVIVFLWGSIGLNIVIYLAALQDIPRDVIEAAKVDGAHRWSILRHVTLPALVPVTIFEIVWSLITALQFFDLLVTTTNGGPAGKTNSIVFLLYEVAFKRTHRYGYGAAIAVSLAVVCLLLAGLMAFRVRRRGEAMA